MFGTSLATIVAAVLALVAIGATPAATAATSAAAATSKIGGSITDGEVMRRAQNWVDRKIRYSQTSTASDLGGTRRYRTDCSGFIDMALHLGGDPNTGGIPGYSGGGGSYFHHVGPATHRLTPNDVMPGDVFDDTIDGHAFLFERWDADGVHMSYFNFGGGSSGVAPPEHHVHETFAQAQVGFEPVTNYEIYRYHNLVNAKAYVFWRGTNDNLYEAHGEADLPAGSQPTGPVNRNIGPLGSALAAGVDARGNTYVFWKGAGDAANLWEAYWNGTKWVGPLDRGMGPLGSNPSVAIAPGGKAYVFWKGANGDLYEAQGAADAPAGTQFNGPFNRGMGPLGSPPAVGIDAANHTYVFWKGPGDAANLWEAYWNGSKWVGPLNRGGGPLGSAPGVAINHGGTAFVFWKGAGDAGDLWEAKGAADAPGGTQFNAFNRGMGPLGSAPAAGVESDGNPYVFWTGPGANADLWEAYWNGSKWVGRFDRGMGPLGSQPTVAIFG